MSDFRQTVKLTARYRGALTDAIAIWENMDDYDDPAQVIEEVITTLKNGLQKGLKPGDKVITLETGKQWTLTDIQYEHNRYQVEGISGWIYGIDNLQYALDYWVDFALQNYRESHSIPMKK
ncbi:hypothetical protein ACFVS2_26110 [Brevibacillus sp. NPDC058079]|uniref:hypothetical protein n=1 Tax=Brevibacillus sp. NPDC058079 TaxID=3346330 RepID=UPI0036EBD333